MERRNFPAYKKGKGYPEECKGAPSKHWKTKARKSCRRDHKKSWRQALKREIQRLIDEAEAS